jgi:hypothetical protein
MEGVTSELWKWMTRNFCLGCRNGIRVKSLLVPSWGCMYPRVIIRWPRRNNNEPCLDLMDRRLGSQHRRNRCHCASSQILVQARTLKKQGNELLNRGQYTDAAAEQNLTNIPSLVAAHALNLMACYLMICLCSVFVSCGLGGHVIELGLGSCNRIGLYPVDMLGWALISSPGDGGSDTTN